MKCILFSLVFLILIVSCHDPGIASATPRCIYKEIKQQSKDPGWITGAIKEYEFQGKLVYAFEPDTRKIADGATTIKDADCNTLCHIGGFGGMAINQCNGENFFKTALFKRIIWEKR